jgi:hypothetical protein
MIHNIINSCQLVEIRHEELISIDGGNWWSDFKAGFVSAFNSIIDGLVEFATVD